MTTIEYYLCRLHFNGVMTFVVWISDEVDGFLRDFDGLLLMASTLEGIAAEARRIGIVLENEEPAEYDFERLCAWLKHPVAEAIDCRAFLNAWNFFDDLAGLHSGAETPYTHLSRQAADCYDKLFWGNNLPTMTPPGERYDPTWSDGELDDIRRVMEAGMEVLKDEFERGVQMH